MTTSNWTAAYNLAVFLTWTVTSFLCHFCGKAFLLSVSETWQINIDDFWRNVWSSVVLTFIQIALCYVSVDVQHTKDVSSLRTARITHVLATFTTNLSMSFMFASSTLAVKLMEPITSAVTQFYFLRTSLSPVSILSLPIIVGGAITFSGNPFADTKISLGFCAAFISNFILAIRNMAIKKINSGDQNALKLKIHMSHCLTFSPVLLGGSILLFYMEGVGVLPPQMPYAVAMCFLSGVFHVAYSYVSTGLVLSQLSVVSHAVANIMKRVLVVLMLYVVGKRKATPYNFLGLAVCTLGLFLYAWDKQTAVPRRDVVTGNRLNWLSKPYKIPWIYLLVTPCCLMAFWGGAHLFESTHFQSESSVPVIRRFLELKKSISLTQESAIFQEQEAQLTTPDHFLDFTFGPDSLKLPEDWLLQPNLQAYPTEEREEMINFLQRRLIDDPAESNYLSPKLKTTVEVIKEAQRIHYNMFEDVIGKYKYCMLLDTADIENKGDPAITIGELYYLTRLGIEIVYYCSTPACTSSILEKAAKIAWTYSPEELIILLHGGGNINAYYWHDDLRLEIFEKFRGFQFVIFPQSIWLHNITSKQFQQCINTYCCNENLTFVLRDHQSYFTAQKYFNGTSRLLVAPDMAFHIGPVKRFMSPVFDILWIKRSDNESPGYDTIPSHPPHLRLHVSDWFKFLTPKAATSLEKPFYSTVMGLFFTQRGRVVITDRIHGHIFSTLLDIPHVLLDNKAKKLSSYHNSWTRGLENTRLTDSPDEALKLALELLEIYGEHQLPPRAPWLNVSETFQKINYSLPETDFP